MYVCACMWLLIYWCVYRSLFVSVLVVHACTYVICASIMTFVHAVVSLRVCIHTRRCTCTCSSGCIRTLEGFASGLALKFEG